MSYHILHQFDEQWLADLKQDTDKQNKMLGSFTDGHRRAHRARLAARESKRWAFIAAAILLATFALLYAIDANRRAEALQQRLDRLETIVK